MNIKKRVFSLLSSCYVVGCLFAQNILISTPTTSLVLSAPEKGELKYIYYGAKLSDRDFQTIWIKANMQLIRFMGWTARLKLLWQWSIMMVIWLFNLKLWKLKVPIRTKRTWPSFLWKIKFILFMWKCTIRHIRIQILLKYGVKSAIRRRKQ